MFVTFGVCRVTDPRLKGQPTLGPFETPRPTELKITRGSEEFDAEQALNGSFSDRDHCARVPNGLWIEVDGKGECIRYYAQGLAEDNNDIALVYFSGDYVLRSAKGVSYLSASYAATSPEQIEEDMSDWSSQAQRPAIYLARPGIHGSSGDNNIRRTLREIELMNRALDMLRERYRISSFILAGQSGGGQIIAALLNMRSDIEASAISSGLLSVKQFSTHWKYGGEIPGQLLYDAKSWYDPVDEIENIRRDLPPKIYLISDPEDRSVPFYTQLNYIRRLRSIGLNPQHIYAYAPRPQRHQLAAHGKLAAALLAQGKSGMEIRRALQELDSPPLE